MVTSATQQAARQGLAIDDSTNHEALGVLLGIYLVPPDPQTACGKLDHMKLSGLIGRAAGPGTAIDSAKG